MKRVFFLFLIISCSLVTSAQTSGGQIRRNTPKPKTEERKPSKPRHTTGQTEQSTSFQTLDIIQPVSIGSLSTYNVVVESFSNIEKARGLCQSLRDKGYTSVIYKEILPEMTMYRITIGSTNNEQDAINLRTFANNIYSGAWILYIVNGHQERYY